MLLLIELIVLKCSEILWPRGFTASQALREGAAKLRKQGIEANNSSNELLLDNCLTDMRSTSIKEPKDGKKIFLSNERAGDVNYWDDPKYCKSFEPPHKKIKQVEM